jgi:hypothetical protein
VRFYFPQSLSASIELSPAEIGVSPVGGYHVPSSSSN